MYTRTSRKTYKHRQAKRNKLCANGACFPSCAHCLSCTTTHFAFDAKSRSAWAAGNLWYYGSIAHAILVITKINNYHETLLCSIIARNIVHCDATDLDQRTHHALPDDLYTPTRENYMCRGNTKNWSSTKQLCGCESGGSPPAVAGFFGG